jgi:membrane-associated HD superfamily phosphohydrolase
MQVAFSSSELVGKYWARSLAADIHGGLLRKLKAGRPIDQKYLPYLTPGHPFMVSLFDSSAWVFRHSVIVGSSGASAGAKVPGVNPDRVRLFGYAHDAGKMFRTDLYSEENGQGSRAHPKKIETFTDLRIMLSHPRLSQKYAWEYGLPDDICDLLVEHHGTVRTRIRLSDDVKRGHPEESFLYCGPRPSTKESAIIMCADSISAFFEKKMDEQRWSQERAPVAYISEIVGRIHGELQKEEQLDERVISLADQKIVMDGIKTWLIRFYSGMRLFGTPQRGERISDGRFLPWPKY